MLLECINTSVWNLFIIPEEDWSQSKLIEEYEVNKLKNEDGYSCFHAFVQLPGHSSKTVILFYLTLTDIGLIWYSQSEKFIILHCLENRMIISTLYDI